MSIEAQAGVGEPPRSPFTATRLTVNDFEETYGVHASLLPFDYLDDCRIDQVRRVGEFLDSRPPTAKYVSQNALVGTRVLGDETERYSACERELFTLDQVCLLFGWWPASKSKHGGTQYGNPRYAHPSNLEHIRDRDERLDLLKQAAALGLPSGQIAPAVGYGGHEDPAQSVCWITSSSGLRYSELLRDGIETMSRTWKTAHEWGHPYVEIADAFGMNPSTVRSRVCKDAQDFEPPSDPSYAAGWREVITEVER